MKDLVWDKVLSVGHDDIDDDHRKLVDLFNMLNHAVAAGEKPDYLAAILQELINFTVWHFSHEERLMIKYDYDAYTEHRSEHQALIKSVGDLQQKIQESGHQFTSGYIEFLERWLTEHILTDDMRLGSFLAELA